MPLGQIKERHPAGQWQQRDLRHTIQKRRDGSKATGFVTEQPPIQIKVDIETRRGTHCGFPPHFLSNKDGIGETGHFGNQCRLDGFASIFHRVSWSVRVGWIGHLNVNVGVIAEFHVQTFRVSAERKFAGCVGGIAKDPNLTAHGTAKCNGTGGHVLQTGLCRVNATELVGVSDAHVVGGGIVAKMGRMRFSGTAKQVRCRRRCCCCCRCRC